MTDYFDDQNQIDPFELQNRIEERQKQRELDRHIDMLEKGQRFSEGAGATWEAVLKEEGLDQETYNKIFQEDEESVKRAIAQGMRTAARGIASKAKGKQDPQEPPRRQGRQVLQDPHGKFVSPRSPEGIKAAARMEQERRDLEHYREKAGKRGLDESDELDIIGLMFPDPL